MPRLLIVTADITGRERYQLLTSLVVPRPIGWISTFSREGGANLAPFSYFTALAASPMLIGVSIGHRKGVPKDSLRNILDTGAFCLNIVTEPQLEEMNRTAGEFPPEIDEFAEAGLPMARAERVEAPYVGNCPAVLECTLFREVDLGDAPNTLIIGEVVAVRLAPELDRVPGTYFVETEALRPVGRLWGNEYGLIRGSREIVRAE